MTSEKAERRLEAAREAQLAGDVEGSRRLFADLLDALGPEPSRVRAMALYYDGLSAFRQGAQAESRRLNDAALGAARAVGDTEAESLALVGLGRIEFREGDYDRVRALATEARELTGGPEEPAGVVALHMLAAGTRLSGDYDRAAELYEESLALNRRLGDTRMVGIELHNLAHVELHRGNVETAERLFSERAAISNLDDPYEAAMTHLNDAALAFARGDRELAAELLPEARSTLDAAGIVLDPDDAFEVDWLTRRL